MSCDLPASIRALSDSARDPLFRITPGGWHGALFVYLGPLTGDHGLPEADCTLEGQDHGALGGELDGTRDVDGDGQVDLLVGNGYLEINGDSATAYPSGNSTAWLLLGPLPTGTYDSSSAEYTFTDDKASGFGTQVQEAGDAIGDGTTDVLIGSWWSAIHLFDLPPGEY